MSQWFNQLGGLLQQYASGQGDPARVHEDAAQAMNTAPKNAVVDALSGAFQSSETPPFAQMVGHLFSNADGQQRAGLLNSLLSGIGSNKISELAAAAGVGHLAGALSGGAVTPQQAEQMSPQDVQQLAQQAEQHDPAVVNRASEFLSGHAGLIRTLGAGALAVFLGQLSRRL